MTAARAPRQKTKSRARRVWGWIGLILLGLFLILAASAVWAWTQRYSLIENQIVDILGERGIEAELQIASATRTRADVRDIRLSHAGERFAVIEHLNVDYQWRDLLEGRVERIALDGVEATITVDASGQIIDGWMPEPTGDSRFVFPPRGIALSNGDLTVSTPFGEARAAIKADVSSAAMFSASGTLAPTTLRLDGVEASLAGPFTLSRDGADTPYRVNLPEAPLSLSHPNGAVEKTKASVTATYQDGTADGTASLIGGQYRAAGGVFGTLGEARITARYSEALDATATLIGGTLDSEAGLAAEIETVSVEAAYDGDLRADIVPALRNVRVTDPARRRELARTLSLAEALSEVPVARNFAPSIATPLERLLGGSDVSGDMALSVTQDARTLTLKAPLTLIAGATQATLTPLTDTPLYRFAAGEEHYDINARAVLSRPLPLTLAPLSVRVRSTNGLSVGGVLAASGRVITGRDWTGVSPTGAAARLGPLSVGFDYDNPGAGEDIPTTASRLTLRGAADYDGDVPGGTVRGLDAGGTLRATLREGRSSADFTPSGPVRFARLDTTSDWSIADFTGTLTPVSPLFTRSGETLSRIQTELSDATFTALRSEDAVGGAASMDMSVGEAALSGVIRGTTQNWDIDFARMSLRSPTFPIAETDLSLPEGALSVALSVSERTQFTLSAPSSILITPGYVVRGMALDVSGTAEDYELDFSGGRVRLIPQGDAEPLPVLPASGRLRFADGTFTGTARTVLPKAEDQPIDVTYRLVDGRGEADVLIRGLRFTPKGLQPQDYAPALKGKIADVDGLINADLDIQFGGDAPLSGTGTVEMMDMAFGTAPGPVKGLNGTVTLTSLFPVVTAPGQRITLDSFDPGIPLLNGAATYSLVETGVDIRSASWPIGDGAVSFDPFLWTYGASENRVTLRVAGVEIGEFLKDIGNGALVATGTIEGVIPVVVKGIDVDVQGGRLEVAGGGRIQYKGKTDLSESIPNEYAGKAFKALENFNYDSLFAEIDGPLDGEITVGLLFTGSNPDVLYNVPFQFDVTVQGELFNIARSFNTNATIKSQVGQALKVAE